MSILDILCPLRRMKKLRRSFLSGREPMDDAEFVRWLEPANRAQERLVVFVRRFVAAICGVAPEMIHPTDSLETLCSIMDWHDKCSWLSIDIARLDRWRFSIEFNFDYGRLEEMSSSEEMKMIDSMPPFGKPEWKRMRWWIRRRWPEDGIPQTFGEWVVETAMVMLRYAPKQWRKKIGDVHQNGTNKGDAALF